MKSQEPEICLQQKGSTSKMNFDFQELLCSKGNVSIMLCQNKNCSKTPFICSQKNCDCHTTHKKCLKIGSEQFFAQISQKLLPTQQIKERVEKIVNEAIDYISKIRDQIELNLKYLGLNHDEQELIDLLSRKQFESVTGAKVWKVSQSIYDQSKNSSSYILNEINKFWAGNKEKFKKNFEKLKELATKETQDFQLFLDSDIISNSTDIDTLLSFFQKKVLKTQLLYSAKKSSYEMSKYQKSCQGKKNTLLLIRSKQGKVFGGFWDLSVPPEQGLATTFSGTFSKESFVFSLTNKDKFKPNPRGKQIFTNFLEGPNYGNNFLAIYKEQRQIIQPATLGGGGFGFGNGLNGGGLGNFGNPQTFGMAPILDGNFGMGINGGQTELKEHYCVIFQSKLYLNQKYQSDEESRIKFAGTKQKMFPITEWQVHQLIFDENDQ